MNKTIYKQTDSRWSSLAYPTKKSTFGGNGCGCCACVHVAMEQDSKSDWNPNSLRKYMCDKGYAVSGQGTTWNGITETLKYIGHSNVVKIWSQPMSEAWTELNKGDRIGVILFNSSKAPNGTRWTTGGHYVAFTDYKIKDGKHYFYCKDSGNRNHDGWYTYENSMKGCVSKVWIVQRLAASVKATTYKPSAPYTKGLPNKTVKKGSKGTNVKHVQTFLNWCINAKLSVDGSCGKHTVAAIKKYQKTYKLKVDGIFGSQSLKKAKAIVAQYAPKTASQTSTTASAATTNKDKILAKAKELSGKKETRTTAYKTALNKAFPSRSGWGSAAKAGRSCDVFVAVVLRSTGLGNKCPRGLKGQYTYKPKNFTRLVYKNVTPKSVSKTGDIIIYKKAKGSNPKGHACIRAAEGIYQANNPKYYPHYTKGFSKLSTKRPEVIIFRAK